MKRLVILGAGTAGTMMANHLHRELDDKIWEIDVVDESVNHYYQPGYVFLPFDIYKPEDIIKPVRQFIPKGVNLINDSIDKVIPNENMVRNFADGISSFVGSISSK